ncbi:MAG: hypothetical protein M3Y56_03980 [Armatimonadota bacterium]|nr:hypothetical protein [Armatimonadota bacterium]
MNMIAYGGEACLSRRAAQPLDLTSSAVRTRAGRGAICAGLSALIAGSAAILQQYSAFTTPSDQAVVWVILTAWLLYWGMADALKRSGTVALEERESRRALPSPLMNRLPG